MLSYQKLVIKWGQNREASQDDTKAFAIFVEIERWRQQWLLTIPSVLLEENDSSRSSLAFSMLIVVLPHTHLFATSDAFAAADIVFFQAESENHRNLVDINRQQAIQ